MKRILSLIVLLASICFVADAQYKLKYQYTSTSPLIYFDVDENLKVSFDEYTICINEQTFAFGEETKIEFFIPVTEIILNKTDLTLEEGKEEQLIVTVLPENATDKTVTWFTNDESVAMVSADGIVKAIGPGIVRIYAYCGGLRTSCLVQVISHVDLEVLARERQALIDLYNATDGDHWINNENWCSDKPLNEWYGINTNWRDGKVYYIKLNNNNLNGKLPKSFGDLSGLEYLYLDENNICAPDPEAFENLIKLKRLHLGENPNLSNNIFKVIGKLKNLEILGLSGCGLSGTIPEEIDHFSKLEELYMSGNNLSGPIPDTFRNLTKLKTLCININPLNCEIPEWIGELTNLTHLLLDWCDLTGEIPESIGNLKNLVSLTLHCNKLTGTVPSSIWQLPNLIDVNLDNNQFSEMEPESTDFSRDGEVMVLQNATVGKGIDLVFLGDGFLDVDIESGKYEEKMRWCMETLFAYEPYKTFRDRFNVYSVVAVSANSHIHTGSNVAINYSDEKCIEYALKIPNINQKELHVCVIPSNDYFMGEYYTAMYMDGSYFSYVMGPIANILQHEVGGHGIGKLADEYFISEETFTNFEGLDYDHSNDYFLNVDYHSTPNDVLWKHFMNDSRYKDQVGIYEGAFANYSKGIFRSTENSIMRYDSYSTYNAPSREAIYKAIMKASEGDDWIYDYEEFVKYDEINRNATTRANYVEKLPEVDVENWKRHHKAPVFINKTWREAVEESKKK